MTTKRAYFQSRTRAAGGFAAVLLGLSALGLSATSSVGATKVTGPTAPQAGITECAAIAAGTPTTAFATYGNGTKTDGTATFEVSGSPDSVTVKVVDPAGVRLHGVAVQHEADSTLSIGYYFGVPVAAGGQTTALTADGGGRISGYTICYDTKGGGGYGGGGSTTTTTPETTTTVPETTTTVPQTTTTVPQTTTTVPQTTTTVPQTTTTVPQTTTTVPETTTTTAVSGTTITTPETTTTSVLGTTITQPEPSTSSTAPTEVLGTQVSRSLPRTGLAAMPLTEAGLVLVMLGLACLASGRIRQGADS